MSEVVYDDFTCTTELNVQFTEEDAREFICNVPEHLLYGKLSSEKMRRFKDLNNTHVKDSDWLRILIGDYEMFSADDLIASIDFHREHIDYVKNFIEDGEYFIFDVADDYTGYINKNAFTKFIIENKNVLAKIAEYSEVNYLPSRIESYFWDGEEAGEDE